MTASSEDVVAMMIDRQKRYEAGEDVSRVVMDIAKAVVDIAKA